MIKELTGLKWDKLVGESEQGSIFCSTRWLSLYGKPIVLIGYYKGDKLVGGIAGISEVQGMGTTHWQDFKTILPLTPFTGIVVGNTEGMKYTTKMSLHNEVASSLIGYLGSLYTNIEIANHYTYPDIRPFLWAGYTAQVKYTYVVSLDYYKETWDNFEQDTRYEINKAEKNGTMMRNGTMDEFLEQYNAMWEHKKTKSPMPDEFFLEMEEKIPMSVYLAGDAGVVMLTDGKRAYYILGASVTKGNSSFCLWEAMKDLYVRGIKEVDLVGCNNKSISLFKRGFGGRLCPYYVVTRNA